MSLKDASQGAAKRAGEKLPRQAHSAGNKEPERKRKLHRGHFAFMRAVLQGMDTRQSWNRYLRIEGEHDDVRNVKKTIQWMRDEFAAAAKRCNRYGTARLIQIDATTLIEHQPVVPTLEQFALEHDLQDFSQAEQLEYYQAQYGSATTARQSRRKRLIAKQLEALYWLEQLVGQPPHSSDAVGAWLHPDLARYLEAAGIGTLRQLVDRVNGIGLRWWAGIKAIGAIKAQRIVEWLRAHEASIGLSIGEHVSVPRSRLDIQDLQQIVPKSTAVVPLDKLVVPAELDGSNGLYRAPQHLCLLQAHTDYEAVLAWIQAKQGASAVKPGAQSPSPNPVFHALSNTQRAYLKEAERFLLWAVVQHQKPLSSMTPEDCHVYRAFLADPTPADQWCGPRNREKWSPLWRPFEGPLSLRAQQQAVTILKSLYKFLVEHGYLLGNPWNGVSVPQSRAGMMNQGRSFTQAQWHFLCQQLAALPETSANRRLRFALQFFYATGLRLSEGVQVKVDDLNRMVYPGDSDGMKTVERWELQVTDKGGKTRNVPLPLQVMEELAHYLASRNLDSNPQAPSNRGAYLIGKATDVAQRAPWCPSAKNALDPKQGLAAGTLYEQLKNFFAMCAEALVKADAQSAECLAAASTHWLRHAHCAHAMAAGMALEVVQQNIGRLRHEKN